MARTTERRGARAVVRVVAVGAFVLALLAPAGAANAHATAADRADTCGTPGAFDPQPWHQQMYAPERIWSVSYGTGITVAVLDTGVDAGQPHLRGVAAGFDALAGKGSANTDCPGNGTQVAGVIAAQPSTPGGFSGLAPGVTILPIRVTADLTDGQVVALPQVMARGFDEAVDRGAKVIVVSAVAYDSTDGLKAAVKRALDAGITVVAAVGDLAGAPTMPPPYPASYDGVIGVGAVDALGNRYSKSQFGDYVDLVAPGANVVTLQRGDKYVTVNGTGVAAGFVGATAALLMSRRGGSVSPKDVRAALFSTAMPRGDAQHYGNGIVDPYAAVNSQPARTGPEPLPPVARPDAAATSPFVASRDLAVIGMLVVTVAVVIVLLVATALPRGRRRFWRPRLAAPLKHEPEPIEPGPPALLFDEVS